MQLSNKEFTFNLSIGIASDLLGKQANTCHAVFGLPVPFDSESVSNISADSDKASYIRRAKIIICDEASMIPQFFLTLLDKLLKDIMVNDLTFGGKSIILTGDFRQTLPIIKKGSKQQKIMNSLKKNGFWNLFEQRWLTANMRLNEGELEFSNWLRDLGNGQLPNYTGSDLFNEDTIRLPKEACLQDEVLIDGSLRESNEDDMIDFVFGNPFVNENNQKRAILCPLNSDTLAMNEKILAKLEGIIYFFK